MTIVTSTRSGAPRVKPFAWSFSRLKNFEVCPKRHWEIDLEKNFKEPPGQALDWGSYVHDKLAERCGPSRTQLPPDLVSYEPWVLKVLGTTPDSNIYVEQALAMTKNFTSTGNFDNDVWLRVKCDFYKVVGDVALAVDWKTGKILEDSVQLALTAACIFAKHPEVKAVRSTYVWLKEDAESSETFFRDDMPTVWRNIWHRIEAMETAFKHTNYPPTPSGICVKFCAVKSCPHNGKGTR
jgi:hypothetical protein